MKRTTHENARCPIARSLDVIGDWWSLLIVRDTLAKPRRFSELQASLKMAKNILAARLKTLVKEEILVQQPAEDGSAYLQYALTDRGRALFPVIVALAEWGEDHLFPEGRATTIVDRKTRKPVRRLIVKAADGRALQAGDTVALVPDEGDANEDETVRRPA